MNKPLHSSSWHRVSDFKPRLSVHAKIHRHHYRGQLWYVIQDRTSGRFHRFTPAAYLVTTLMDGCRSVQEIWETSCARLGDKALTQDEIMHLLSLLHNANVLFGDTSPDYDLVGKRVDRMRRFKRVMSFINPLAVRLPVIDPDRFLSATFPLVRPLMSWFGVVVFLVSLTLALVLAGLHWDQLTGNVAGRVLAAENILLLFLAYPFVKFWHELGHGYAVKRLGGEVHEIGIMFLVFMPVPYVDASDATSFYSKWQRALVGGAGILVEIFLAALALFFWVEAEEGLLRAFAFNVILIGGVSTLFFNGNPLLRFDGYYVLADLLEIPNLGKRSSQFVGYLIQRYLIGLKETKSPARSGREGFWLLFYAVASFVYRLFIMTAIALFVASEYPVVGMVVAIWAIFLMLVLPVFRHLRFLLVSPVLRRCRARAVGVIAGTVAGLASLLLLVPLPYATVSEGIVWTPAESAIYAGANGVVTRIMAKPNSSVGVGEELIQVDDPLLDARVKVLEARVRQLSIRHQALKVANHVEAIILGERLLHAEADLELARKRQEELLIRSKSGGRLILYNLTDLQGRYVKKGEILGYIAKLDEPVIHVIVDEDRAALVRSRVNKIEVRLVDQIEQVLPAQIYREVPALSDALPSLALSTVGGGKFVVDPTDPRQFRVLTNLLHLELRPLHPLSVSAVGGRVYVRFDHGLEPIASRVYRSIR
ncbi:MAG: peptidase M50, partial [Gammaproteobacteria bacterium]|nr:peptidase M50 [Gammaproteobacteria bacterium]